AIEREIAQADGLQEAQARTDFGECVAGDGKRSLVEPQLAEERFGVGDGERREFGDVPAREGDGERRRIEPRALAGGAGLARALFVFSATDEAGAGAYGAPAVARVVGEKSRVGFGKASSAGRAGAAGGMNRLGVSGDN